MNAWWEERTPRERILLLALLTAGIVLAAVQLVWLPLDRAQERAVRARDAARLILADVQAAASRAGQQAKTNVPATDDPRGTVIRTAREANLTLTRLEPGQDGLSVWMDEVKADELHRWLGRLQADHGLEVRRASVRANDDNATVRAQILFGAGNG